MTLAALLAALVLAAGSGCATYAFETAPQYGKAWQDFAVQAGSASMGRTAVPADSPPVPDPSWDEAFRGVPRAREAAKKAHRLLKEEAPSRSEVRGLIDDLQQIEREVSARRDHDPLTIERIRAQIEEVRKRMEAKLLEISRIEPAFDINSRSQVRVAVVRIGDGVETIFKAERDAWAEFLKEAGFSGSTVFITSPLTGDTPSAADLRVAGARLGAQAVLAYTTSANTSSSLFGESAAVLSFAKCMVVDTRTEYLYFNAEGESRLRRVSLPFTVCSLCLEDECLGEAVVALRGEILHELARLGEDQ
jgi:hypothetical protein